MSSLTSLTLKAALDGLADKSFSSLELTQAHVEAVEAARALNAFVLETPDRALEMAKASDARRASGDAGALDGAPLGIKDLFCTEGVRTTAASKILGDFVPTYESTVTANLWRDGAVMLGKLNLDQFAMGSSNETSCFGPVVNPWRGHSVEGVGGNAKLTPGGSSGGSASAVAAELCLGATATDTGGSIRQPAAFTGTVGIKPTYGRCSRWGVVAFASSLDQAGPMARTVEDAAILLTSMAGHDPKDSTSLAVETPDFASFVGKSVKGLRIGVPKEYRVDNMPAEIDALWEQGIAWLKDAGCEIVEVSLPHTKYALPAYYIVAPRRGVVEPRPLRRHALRPARRGREPHRHLREIPRRGLRRRGEAADHDRHLCALRRLLRRLLPEGAQGPPPHRRRLRSGLRKGRRPADAHRALGRPSRSATARTIRWPCT